MSMKRITESQAIKMIPNDVYPKCKVSRGVFETVDSIKKLNFLKKLSEVQSFELYEDTTDSVSLPKDAMKLSIDDAFDLIASHAVVHCIKYGKDSEISNLNELREIIRSCQIRGDQFVLYWLMD